MFGKVFVVAESEKAHPPNPDQNSVWRTWAVWCILYFMDKHIMEQLRAILVTWPIVLAVELSVVAFFVWTGRDKPSHKKPSN